MHVLVLCDNRWYLAAIPRAGLAPLEASGYTLDWIEDASQGSAERMAGYPLVALAKSNDRTAADETAWMTPEVEAAFAQYVRRANAL